MSSQTPVENEAPTTIQDLNLEPRGRVFPSPASWKDHVFYQILPDRFSDGREDERPQYDPAHPEQFRAPDKRAWMQAGLGFNGGTLRGIRSKLDYLQGLGITGLWLNPVFKQRADLETYHGYAIQNFLAIDPRFGTIQDLRNLIDDAHDRGMLVVLDVVIDHTGNNWFYGPDVTGIVEESLPYRYEPPYSFGGWRSGKGECIPQIQSLEDGCWPIELQRLEAYNRCGSICDWSSPDPMDPNAEYRRGDFFDLKKLNGYNHETMRAVIRCYQYWIAVTDCDGFRIDAAKHIPKDLCQQCCFAIHRYAQSIGKDNFLLVGEITDLLVSINYLSLLGSVFDRALSAVLDIKSVAGSTGGRRARHGAPANYYTLWLTPIFASPNYHGYAVSDFFRVEPALGGEAAWRELVAACRRRGLRLVLDFVANHVSDQHAAFMAARAAADSPERWWFRFRHWPQKYDCFFDQPHQPELDGEQAAVREHLLAAAVHWLRAGCDGFRLDYAHGLSHGFWSQFRAATRAAAADSVCFGEITHTPQVVRSYAGRLDGCLDFALCELLRETFARGGLSRPDR